MKITTKKILLGGMEMFTFIVVVSLVYVIVKMRKRKGTWKESFEKELVYNIFFGLAVMAIGIGIVSDLSFIFIVAKENQTEKELEICQNILADLESKQEVLQEKYLIETQGRNQNKQELHQFIESWEENRVLIAEQKQRIESLEEELKVITTYKFLLYFGS